MIYLKFLQKRRNALLIAVLGVLLITVWNVNRSLEKRADDIREAWAEKYGAETQLKDRCSYASQLWSLCQSHSELSRESGELRRDYNGLYDAMREEDWESMEQYNLSLTRTAAAASRALCALPSLSQTDRASAERYVNYMDNAARLLRDSEYNTLCQEYARLCDSPWLRLLRGVIFVDAPLQVGADAPNQTDA